MENREISYTTITEILLIPGVNNDSKNVRYYHSGLLLIHTTVCNLTYNCLNHFCTLVS